MRSTSIATPTARASSTSPTTWRSWTVRSVKPSTPGRRSRGRGKRGARRACRAAAPDCVLRERLDQRSHPHAGCACSGTARTLEDRLSLRDAARGRRRADLPVRSHQGALRSAGAHRSSCRVTRLPRAGAAPASASSGAEGAAIVALRVAFRALVIVMAIIGAEYAARLAYRTAHSSGNTGDFIGRRGGGPAIRVNGLGFREREIPPKQAGRYRIAVVGRFDLVGAGNRGARALLEPARGVSRSRLRGVQLRAAGRPRSHGATGARRWRTSPDFVVLQLYITAFETAQMQRPRPYRLLPESLDRRLEPSSMLYDLLAIQWAQLQQELGVVESYEQYLARNLRDPDSPNSRARVRAASRVHRSVAPDRRAERNRPVPGRGCHGPERVGVSIRLSSRARQTLCASEQIPCLDLLPAFSKIKDPRTMWVSPFDAHPNAEANRRVAYEILARFAPVWHR